MEHRTDTNLQKKLKPGLRCCEINVTPTRFKNKKNRKVEIIEPTKFISNFKRKLLAEI